MSSKIEQEKFNKEVGRLLSNYGASKDENRDYKYLIQTTAGELSITMHEAEKSAIFSIYMRFTDYQKALKVLGYQELGMNPKWNIHAYESKEAIRYLNYRLQLVKAGALQTSQ